MCVTQGCKRVTQSIPVPIYNPGVTKGAIPVRIRIRLCEWASLQSPLSLEGDEAELFVSRISEVRQPQAN